MGSKKYRQKTNKRAVKIDSSRLKKFDKSWKLKTLDNGLRIVHVPSEDDNRFYLGATIMAGSRYENEEIAGVSHLLEHMMFRGSKKYPSFSKLASAFEWLGGTWNAGTGHEHTEYYYSGSLQFAEEAIDLFTEFFLHPKFEDFKIEKKIIFREIEGELNEYGVSTDLDHQMQKLMWPNSCLASPIMGSKKTVGAMTLTEMKKHWKKLYVPSRTVVCAVGGSETSGILDRLADSFSQFSVTRPTRTKKFNEPQAIVGPKCAVVPNNDNEYQLQLSFRCSGEWSKHALMCEITTRILADGFCSRLGKRIREELGMVYDIDAELTMFKDTGSIDIYSSVDPKHIEKFLTEVGKIIVSIRDKGPTKDELERAKRRAMVDLGLLPDDPDMIGFKLSWALLSGKKPSLSKSIERIQTVTKEDVQKTCQKFFKPKRMACVLLGPKDKDLAKKCQQIIKESFR